MIAEKLIWTSQDTFKTMHDKIVSLIGKEVYYNMIVEGVVTIFSVTEIVKDINSYIDNTMDVWAFTIFYGTVDSEGCRFTLKYRFSIPRISKVFEDDLQKCQIVYDPKHPFIFYQI